MQLAIQIRPAATVAEVSEAVVLLRPPNFLVKFLAANWYACALSALVVVFDVIALTLGKPAYIGISIAVLALVAAALLYSWLRWSSSTSSALRSATERMHDISLDPDGIHMVAITGAVNQIPWSTYDSWLEGKSIFILKGKDGAVILPVDDSNRDMLRVLLETRLP
jgi:hypothetical protein